MVYIKTQQRPKPVCLFRFELGDKVILKSNPSVPDQSFYGYKGVIIKRFLDCYGESYYIRTVYGTIRAGVESIYKLVP